MQLGMIGLGRMGGNMVSRLLRAGHQCVAFRNLLEGPYEPEQLPAQLIHPKQGTVMWLADSSAAAMLTVNGKQTR
jgi:6-phosphogluconate dehydrogenase (decarboxylating)